MGTPLELYCLDLNPCVLVVETPLVGLKWNMRKQMKAKDHLAEEKRERLLFECAESLFDYYIEHPDIQAMSDPYSVEFKEVFNMGYQNYDAGEWRTAQHFLVRALDLLSFEDGPSAALLRFMQEPYQFESPEGWKGMHALEEIHVR